MRGIVNELYLDDLREKTLRGQKGQKARGFTVGEATYGYRSVPVGEMRADRRGRPRPDGYRMVVEASEAAIVQRVFREFSEGKAIKTIVKSLNAEGVPGRRRNQKGWSTSTVSRILKNEKYIGRWIWNRTETRRDPRTGRRRRVLKPASEWHVLENEELRIVPQETWDRVAARWRAIDRTWPTRRTNKTSEDRQRSYVETNPPHLLSGGLRCGECGGAMGEVSGKAGGYYGCLKAPKNACRNRLIVRRRMVEKVVLQAIQSRLADTSAIQHVLQTVESEVRRLHADLPDELRLKRAALTEEERRIVNYVAFIGEGKGTQALAEALKAAEQKVKTLREDLRVLEVTADTLFTAPPIEWVAERLAKLQDLMERETARSALLLRRILAPARLTPVTPEVGRPYYKAETALQVLDLLEAPEGGSTSLRWWTRSQPIRSAAELPLAFSLTETRPPFKYQQVAEKASILNRLGLSASAIARRLRVTDKTVTKALRRLEEERH